MERFERFLQTAKINLEKKNFQKKIHLVLGNESCDLDSAISALAYGFLLNSINPDNLIIPVLNIQRKYITLRTIILDLLKESKINLDYLIFKDEIDINELINLPNIRVTLVDHHVLNENDEKLKNKVTEVFDHRPFVENYWTNFTVNLSIKPVGSCATLIANEILRRNEMILFPELTYLLYCTIIFDSIGLVEAHGRTAPQDIEIAEKLERKLNLNKSRQTLFDELWKSYSDTTRIPLPDLLYKDLKVEENIPIPVVPMLIRKYVKKIDPGVLEHFATKFRAPIVVVIGVDTTEGVQRDIGIFYKNTTIKSAVINSLMSSKETRGADLELELFPIDTPNFVCFKQNNINLTRKFVVPLIKDAVKNLKL